MLGDSDPIASVAVKDMDVAKKFYGETLGLEAAEGADPSGVFFKSGKTGVFVYPSQYAGTNQATYVSWTVKDVPATVAGLKSKGVQFEHYDTIPGVTRDGDVHKFGDNNAAWFKDPDGNILSMNDMG